MKTESEIKEYINENFFINRRHAYGIRALINDTFPEIKDLNFRWPVVKDETKYLKPFITFNDAHDYIFGKTREI